jgi:hypothetical protein
MGWETEVVDVRRAETLTAPRVCGEADTSCVIRERNRRALPRPGVARQVVL